MRILTSQENDQIDIEKKKNEIFVVRQLVHNRDEILRYGAWFRDFDVIVFVASI